MLLTTALEETFHVCADDEAWIYANGKLLANGGFATIPAAALNISVKIQSYNGLAGWKSYFKVANSITHVTAAMWKCTNVTQTDDSWTLADYDDSLWSNPVQTLDNSLCPYPEDAMWMWTDSTFSNNYADRSMEIYCRLRQLQ